MILVACPDVTPLARSSLTIMPSLALSPYLAAHRFTARITACGIWREVRLSPAWGCNSHSSGDGLSVYCRISNIESPGWHSRYSTNTDWVVSPSWRFNKEGLHRRWFLIVTGTVTTVVTCSTSQIALLPGIPWVWTYLLLSSESLSLCLSQGRCWVVEL